MQGSRHKHGEQFISGLLLSFQAAWGHKWMSQAEHIPHSLLIATWTEGLEDMTADEIRARFRECRKSMEWPPTIAEFVGTNQNAPKSQEEWHQFGRSIGCDAKPGESWESYIAKLRRKWDAQPIRQRQALALQNNEQQLVRMTK